MSVGILSLGAWIRLYAELGLISFNKFFEMHIKLLNVTRNVCFLD